MLLWSIAPCAAVSASVCDVPAVLLNAFRRDRPAREFRSFQRAQEGKSRVNAKQCSGGALRQRPVVCLAACFLVRLATVPTQFFGYLRGSRGGAV